LHILLVFCFQINDSANIGSLIYIENVQKRRFSGAFATIIFLLPKQQKNSVLPSKAKRYADHLK